MCNNDFVLQKWAHAFRDTSYYAAVDTNNGTEALNKMLKYTYLPKRKSLCHCLVLIATLFIYHFSPDMNQKYIFENYKMSEDYRLYSNTIYLLISIKAAPSQLFFTVHMQRKLKSHKFSAEDIISLDDGNFEIHKTNTENLYSLNFQEPECTCKDWARHHIL